MQLFFLAPQRQQYVRMLCVNQFKFLRHFLNPLGMVCCLLSLCLCGGSISDFYFQ